MYVLIFTLTTDYKSDVHMQVIIGENNMLHQRSRIFSTEMVAQNIDVG